MNYEEPRQRKSDGRWDWTNMNDGRVYPIGYCRPWREPEGPYWNERSIAEYTATKDKHHTDGHATKEAAAECYRQYQLDHRLRFGEMSGMQRKCDVCGDWTTGTADLDGAHFVLCNAHRNRDEVERLYKAPGSIWHS